MVSVSGTHPPLPEVKGVAKWEDDTQTLSKATRALKPLIMAIGHHRHRNEVRLGPSQAAFQCKILFDHPAGVSKNLVESGFNAENDTNGGIVLHCI